MDPNERSSERIHFTESMVWGVFSVTKEENGIEAGGCTLPGVKGRGRYSLTVEVSESCRPTRTVNKDSVRTSVSGPTYGGLSFLQDLLDGETGRRQTPYVTVFDPYLSRSTVRVTCRSGEGTTVERESVVPTT